MDVDGLEHLLGELHRDLHRGKGIAEVLTNLFRFVLLKPTFLQLEEHPFLTAPVEGPGRP